MAPTTTLDELLTEGARVPVEGWDFGWFTGRATEERPPWGYARTVGERMAAAAAALDIQTGGGEVLAGLPHHPPVLVATESWPPNIRAARRTLGPIGGWVVAAAHDGALPFRAERFDLVVSRHPVHTPWSEIARVLRPGGTFLSQQIGSGTMAELAAAVTGTAPAPQRRQTPAWAAAQARRAGLTVVDVREATLRATFDDIAAVVYFLRKVVWTVPGFTAEAYRPQLAALHERIRAEGPFTAHARRFLIEARRPG